LDYPKGFNANRYTVNIGLTLKKLLSGGKTDSSKINLNIQPGKDYQYKSRSVFKTAVLPGIGVGAILLVFLILQVRSATADNSSIKSQISATNQQTLLKEKKEMSLKQELSELAKKVDELEAANEKLSKIYDSFSTQQDMANADLRAITNNVPEKVNLIGVLEGNTLLTVNGWTPDEDALLTYVAKLEITGRFSKTIISSVKKVTEGGMNFTLILIK
jgi:Tfp pilus assembly protein PilN